MISTLKKKLNKKGFTLAELLIVVAIIAVLAAIAIPVFSSQLTKAKVATDISNLRSAKAAAQVYYLTNNPTTDTPLYYSTTGELVTANTIANKPVTFKAAKPGTGSDATQKATVESLISTNYSAGQVIKVVITADSGEITISAENAPTT